MLPSSNTSAKAFIFLGILTGFVGAFVNPLMSYFLVDELAVEPMYIGLYMVSVTVSGLILSQWLGALADKGASARKLYIIATSGTALALTIYLFTSSFWVVLLAGICFMGAGNGSIPQMLTMSRQWANQHKVSIPQFNARIRASMSFSWMLGPPLGFFLVSLFGFAGSFAFAILSGLLGILFVLVFVPELQTKPAEKEGEKLTKAPLSFWLLGCAVVMGASANIMYSSAMPLYTLNELGLPSYTPGVLLGLAAGVEIPIMLLAGKLSMRFKKTHLMLLSFMFALCFYLGIYFAIQLWQFIALQLLNAIFYGLYAGIGLTLMQEQLPERIGFTSAFYSNAIKIGTMVGATGTGFIAQLSTFQMANVGASIISLCGMAFLLMFLVIKNREQRIKSQQNTHNAV